MSKCVAGLGVELTDVEEAIRIYGVDTVSNDPEKYVRNLRDYELRAALTILGYHKKDGHWTREENETIIA